ncbi:hypothetical protein ACQEVY_19275 [Streptomyces sp. CA-288835]
MRGRGRTSRKGRRGAHVWRGLFAAGLLLDLLVELAVVLLTARLRTGAVV